MRPVGTWITEWAGDGDKRGQITLRHLMQMSSGLGQYAFTLNPFDDGMKWLNSGRSIEAILRTPLADWEPGTKWEYNNINSELLGIVLERLYGMRYSALLRERLWLPMGGERALIHTDSPGGRAFYVVLPVRARDGLGAGRHAAAQSRRSEWPSHRVGGMDRPDDYAVAGGGLLRLPGLARLR